VFQEQDLVVNLQNHQKELQNPNHQKRKLVKKIKKDNQVVEVILKEDVIVEDRVEEKKTEVEKVVEQIKEVKISEPSPKTQTRRRSSVDKKKKESVLSLVAKLNEKVHPMKDQRAYRESKEMMPKAIQEFCDSWGEEGSPNLASEKYGLPDIKFGQEFALEEEEYQDVEFLHKNPTSILIGDGKKLIAADMNDKNEDFNIWIVSDEQDQQTIGPIKVSEFLKDLKVVELEEEEEN